MKTMVSTGRYHALKPAQREARHGPPKFAAVEDHLSGLFPDSCVSLPHTSTSLSWTAERTAPGDERLRVPEAYNRWLQMVPICTAGTAITPATYGTTRATMMCAGRFTRTAVLYTYTPVRLEV